MRDVKTIENELNLAWAWRKQFEGDVNREKNKIIKLEAELEEAKRYSSIPFVIEKGMIFWLKYNDNGYYYMVVHNGYDLSLILLSHSTRYLDIHEDCIGGWNILIKNSQGIGMTQLRDLLIKYKAEYKGTLESFTIRTDGGC